MNSSIRHTGKSTKRVTLLAASTLLGFAAAHAAQAASSSLVLTAYENGIGGESLLSGQYDTALAEISKDRSMGSLVYSSKMNNLCVAHAAKKELEKAKSACDIAVRAARDDKRSSQRYSPGSSLENSYVAIAYTNRAVVHMMAKDMDSAKQDLARAKSLAPDADFVAKNLAVAQAAQPSTIARISSSK